MENNKSKGNSKEFQAEEIDKRFEMDSVNPIPVGPNSATPIINHPFNDAVPGPTPPTFVDLTPREPVPSGW